MSLHTFNVYKLRIYTGPVDVATIAGWLRDAHYPEVIQGTEHVHTSFVAFASDPNGERNAKPTSGWGSIGALADAAEILREQEHPVATSLACFLSPAQGRQCRHEIINTRQLAFDTEDLTDIQKRLAHLPL